MFLIMSIPLFFFVPEDSNSQYLLDKQIIHYFPSWEIHFDSMSGGMRTSQGCLDLLNWYIDLDTKFEVKLSKIFGIRYRNKYLGDYTNHISDHRFEPFFQVKKNLKLLFTITTHYYKGEDELGIGFFLGKDYLNYLEMFIITENFDRNFSLKDVPPGEDKIIYKRHPIKLKTHFNKYWDTRHLSLKFDVSNRYLLQSTEPWFVFPVAYTEKGLHWCFYARFWQDIDKLRLGTIFDLKQFEFHQFNTTRIFGESISEIIIEPMVAYKLTEKWIPNLYLTYNYKTKDDSIHVFSSLEDSLFHYKRDIYAYLLDVEFHPGGNFIWHFGMQRQFYYNNQGREFNERRLLLAFEYRYKNIWFYFVEAMEGDFPIPKWLHNHIYVQLMLKF